MSARPPKTAIVTGTSKGIGAGIVKGFVERGFNVVASSRKVTQSTEVAASDQVALVDGHIGEPATAAKIVETALSRFKSIDALVNNAAIHYEQESLEDISTDQLKETFTTNVFPYFWVTRETLPYMKKGSCIINTSSVTAYRGSGSLIDYASTKGAIVSFTRSLSSSLVKKGIRVNGVAPGPIWTPLIPASFKARKVATFGSDVPMARAGEPAEVAPSYLFLACGDSSYMTGQFLHPNGGEIVNG